MEDCVSKDAIEIIKKVCQTLSLADERVVDVVMVVRIIGVNTS